MTKKKYNTAVFLFVIFLLTTIGLLVYLFVPKYGDITYLVNNYTGSTANDDVHYKTFILKILGDEGELIDLIYYDLNTYSLQGRLVSWNSDKFIAKNNKIKFYYKYDAYISSSGSYFSGDDFVELEYSILDNGLVYFDSLLNDKGDESNLATYYFNMNNNIGVRLSFKQQIEKVRL